MAFYRCALSLLRLLLFWNLVLISHSHLKIHVFLLVEPFYGTICLYNRERREKLSEDFIFHILPPEMQDVRLNLLFLYSVSPFLVVGGLQ